MSKAIRAAIDEAFGFEAIEINSALVSAQNRRRLYWVGQRNTDGSYSRMRIAFQQIGVSHCETFWMAHKATKPIA